MTIQRRISSPVNYASTAGYTLLEVLLVVIIVGVLAAISAPGWLSFMNNQRTNSARSQIFDILRRAQAEAKQTKTPREVRFDLANLRLAILPCPNSGSVDAAVSANRNCTQNRTAIPDAAVTKWETLGNGNLSKDNVTFDKTGNAWVVFDNYGEIVRETTQPIATNAIFKIGVKPTRGGTTKCVIIQTVLGGMREGEGTDCN
ncbi:pilus assembly FimT family protein [Alkalinema pantanalense CENA528]|uniref:pilus assembly FimT family protein n=1 Tax=Alkalinema pantanalense TaxID=1620705 RepID=UPI003D6DC3DD